METKTKTTKKRATKKTRSTSGFQLPTVIKAKESKKNKEFEHFPVDHFSPSLFVSFSTNPLMCKIGYINGDSFESTRSPSNVLGRAAHDGLKYYLGGGDLPTPADDADATKFGYDKGFEYLTANHDGFIEYNTVIKNRADLEARFSFVYYGYVQEFNYEKRVKKTLLVETPLKEKIIIDGKEMPIALKAIPDLVYEDHLGRIIIHDHKITGAYSKPDSIDAAKLIQGAFLYFLVYAKTGRVPYSVVFGEYKYTKNADGSPQLKEYEMVYAETPMMFEYFYRMYYDMISAFLGKQVYVPNMFALYDKEVSIMAYIHRLDVAEERHKQFKAMNVDNITDFMKAKIQNAGSMKQFLETVEKKFISAKTLNFKEMNIEDRIKYKLSQHGIAVEFQDKIEGSAVTLYRYDPGIGIKMSKIESFAADIEQVVETSGIRILAPIPGTGLVGFEIPRVDRLFPTQMPKADGYRLDVGVDILGNPVYSDFREWPHAIAAGATGSGKSKLLNSLIYQFKDMANVQMILLDPKRVELTEWRDIKNLKEYADDAESINVILSELVIEMNKRYDILQERKLKNTHGTELPYIVVVLDEFGDLVTSSDYGAEIKRNVLILAQKSRAAGIHMIIATQRPSVKIIDGDIKMNFPVRIALRVATGTDSKVILDEAGADKLLGKGDMLFKSNEGMTRLQGYNI